MLGFGVDLSFMPMSLSFLFSYSFSIFSFNTFLGGSVAFVFGGGFFSPWRTPVSGLVEFIWLKLSMS